MGVGFAALRAHLHREGGRLWRIGIALAMVGTGLATLGFLIVTAVPLFGAVGLVDPGNLLIGIGVMFVNTLGGLLLGIPLPRMNRLRLIAVLFVLGLPTLLIAGPIGEVLGLGEWIVVGMVTPFCLAVILIGNHLRSESSPTAAPARAFTD